MEHKCVICGKVDWMVSEFKESKYGITDMTCIPCYQWASDIIAGVKCGNSNLSQKIR